MAAERREAPGEKSGAYLWYPQRYATDEHVIRMSVEAEGPYRRLLDYQWLNGSIPSDLVDLAAICKNIPRKKMERYWKEIAPCFHAVPGQPGRLQNRKLERVREEFAEYRRRQIESGRRGGQTAAQRRRSSAAPPQRPSKARHTEPIATLSGSQQQPLLQQPLLQQPSPTPEVGEGSSYPEDHLSEQPEPPRGFAPEGATPERIVKRTPEQQARIDEFKALAEAERRAKAEPAGA